MRKILFICKTGNDYGASEYERKSSGLLNSAQFIGDALSTNDVECKVVEAIDNNCIDSLVAVYKPTTVIIEALWVVPEKFPILKKLHPNVEWFVHPHSNIPFLANEGIATDWIYRYNELGVGIIVNCDRAQHAMEDMGIPSINLPNIYGHQHGHHRGEPGMSLKVGCFGAVRPMKNHLTQAIAAIEYARETDRPLLFHINGPRVENGGGSVLKSLRGLFAEQENAYLMELPWIEHEEFLKCVAHMHIAMQVSLSETFNIVTADAVAMGVPIVVSPEISWASSWNYADPASTDDIKRVMGRVERSGWLVKWNRYLLARHSRMALKRWMRFARNT